MHLKEMVLKWIPLPFGIVMEHFSSGMTLRSIENDNLGRKMLS